MELFAPEDTLTPLSRDEAQLRWWSAQHGSETETQLPVGWQGYDLDFGVDPDPVVCSYMARVILWNGIRSPVRPLSSRILPPRAPSCASEPARYRGATFELPGYGEGEERWVEGTVWVDGELAGADEVAVEVHMRRRDDEPPVTVTTDAEGTYRVTLDGRGRSLAPSPGPSRLRRGRRHRVDVRRRQLPPPRPSGAPGSGGVRVAHGGGFGRRDTGGVALARLLSLPVPRIARPRADAGVTAGRDAPPARDGRPMGSTRADRYRDAAESPALRPTPDRRMT